MVQPYDHGHVNRAGTTPETGTVVLMFDEPLFEDGSPARLVSVIDARLEPSDARVQRGFHHVLMSLALSDAIAGAVLDQTGPDMNLVYLRLHAQDAATTDAELTKLIDALQRMTREDAPATKTVAERTSEMVANDGLDYNAAFARASDEIVDDLVDAFNQAVDYFNQE